MQHSHSKSQHKVTFLSQFNKTSHVFFIAIFVITLKNDEKRVPYCTQTNQGGRHKRERDISPGVIKPRAILGDRGREGGSKIRFLRRRRLWMFPNLKCTFLVVPIDFAYRVTIFTQIDVWTVLQKVYCHFDRYKSNFIGEHP